MSQIKLKHSGGNSVIIAAPDSNPASDVTLKLPQADGSANEFLKTDGSGNLAFAGGGKVKQFKYVQSSTGYQTSSSSYQDLSATYSIAITPRSASNLLVCRFSVAFYVRENNSNDATGYIAITDDDGSSYLVEAKVRAYDYGASGILVDSPRSFEHIKVAGNTNSRTYSIRVKKTAGDDITLNGANTSNSVLSVMEVEP